ncbi:MAG: endonuclease/exonuclease/phosphatase family protein [Bacteriovoracaceae bacterium]|nr:endonuclease/exonuclease/phosphatase family protein [Bacteriovoracaceae bacterium]
MKSIKLLTYNIHKGFNIGNRKFVLKDIKKSILDTQSDIVCLQEVVGHHTTKSKKIKNWPQTSQLEFLADQVWDHHAYGKNAIHPKGHHGNAILSQFPITQWDNYDISTRFEKRGILHAELQGPNDAHPFHLFCIHFGLFRKDRIMQTKILINQILKLVPADSPLLVAGDFNDWQEDVSVLLLQKLNMKEVFLNLNGRHALTFPSHFPLLPLDRIYYKNLKLESVKTFDSKFWKKLSDHLPILAEFKII